MSVLAAAWLALAAQATASATDWSDAAARVGAASVEMGIRPERMPTDLTLPAVEELLRDPAAGYDAAREWGERLSSATALAEPLALAAGWLSQPGAAAIPTGTPADCRDLPAALATSAAVLDAAAAAAQKEADWAASFYKRPERAALLKSFGAVLRHAPLAAVTQEDVRLAGRFPSGRLVGAASRLAAAVEKEIPALQSAAREGLRGRWRCGRVAVSGVQDDRYGSVELRAAPVLVDLGGDNRYDGPAAAAGPGEIRVVVDLGARLVFESSAPAFGSGVFGIGLLYAPTPGAKTLRGGDQSQGSGLFGAGGVWAAGPVTAGAAHFSQGAGAFGAGVFVVAGDSAALTADFAAQGFGYTRGVGLLTARGDDTRADCGLRHPDPREALALISLCQGSGEGPRAHAAGGMGLALFQGRGARLNSSYFSQGAGYWHAFGGLYIRGDGASLQARRYSQGTGVHAGAGLLSWRGSAGRSVLWGVGPAFGWDYGIGWLELRGDRNAVQADWAGARGDVNGRAFADVSGDGNSLRVADWGAAPFKRLSASYALLRVSGAGNALWSPGLEKERRGNFDVMTTPWGATLGRGLILAPSVASATVSWPVVERQTEAAAQGREARAELERAQTLPAARRVERWLFLASAFSLDGGGGEAAVVRLLSLPAEQAGLAVRALRVENFDEGLWVKIIAAAAGAPASRAAEEEFSRAAGMRRVALADVLRYAAPRAALAASASLLKDHDWRLRRVGAILLGASFGQEAGEEPGRLRFLEQASSLARSTFTAGGADEAAAFGALGVRRLTDLYFILALDPDFSVKERFALLAAGDPFDSVKTEGFRRFTAVLRGRSDAYVREIAMRRAAIEALRPRARELLLNAVGDADFDVRAGVLAALGQLGDAGDAALLGGALAQTAVTTREAAALGLARLGNAGREEIARGLSAPSAAVRRAALLAAAFSPDPETAALLRRGFSDGDAFVRLSAVAALGAVPSPLFESQRAAAASDLRRLAAGDPDPSVAASAARVLGQIAPPTP